MTDRPALLCAERHFQAEGQVRLQPKADACGLPKADIQSMDLRLCGVRTIGRVILTAAEKDFDPPMSCASARLSVLTRMSGRASFYCQ